MIFTKTKNLILLFPFLLSIVLLFLRWDSSVFASEHFYKSVSTEPHTLFDVLIKSADSFGILPLLVVLLVLLVYLGSVLMSSYYSNKKNNSVFLFVLLLVSTPTFIFSVLNLSEGVFALFLSMLLWKTVEKKNYVLATIFAIILSGFSFVYVLFAYVMFIYFIRKSDVHYSFSFTLLLFLGLLRELFLPTMNFLQFRDLLPSLASFVFDFGFLNGVSVILLGIATVGFFSLFFTKKFISWGIFTLLLITSIFLNNIFLFTVVISLFAVPILEYLFYKKWVVSFFKYSSFFLLLALLLIVNVSFFQGYVEISPTVSDLQNYAEISSVTISSLLVPSDVSYQMQYYTAVQTFPKNPSETLIFNQILFSSDIDFTRELLLSNGITHVYIDDSYLTEFFDGDEKALLINVKDTDYFTLDYSSDTFSIYQVN